MSHPTQSALQQARHQHPEPFAEGSDQERAALEQFREFFSHMTAERVRALCQKTYADTVWFNDTLKTVVGAQSLQDYLVDSAEAVHDCRVEIHDITRSSNADYFVRWTMTIRFKRFKSGEDTESIGMSHLRFDAQGRIIYHQDYWDSATGLFQHVPVLGWGIRKIKALL